MQAPVNHGGASKNKKPKVGTIAKIAAVAAVVVLLIALVFVFVIKVPKVFAEINKDKYQAVFLNSADGQVYFGKLSELNGDYYKLNDIYYVRRAVQLNPNEQPTQTYHYEVG
ncbi:MAG: hypothetical protein R3B12_05170 [Candidatus Saccharimonadales bacterium]